MEPTSFHGSKAFYSVAAAVAIVLCTVVGTYRLKKSAQLKHWQKAMTVYSLQLEQENQLAKGEDFSEVQ